MCATKVKQRLKSCICVKLLHNTYVKMFICVLSNKSNKLNVNIYAYAHVHISPRGGGFSIRIIWNQIFLRTLNVSKTCPDTLFNLSPWTVFFPLKPPMSCVNNLPTALYKEQLPCVPKGIFGALSPLHALLLIPCSLCSLTTLSLCSSAIIQRQHLCPCWGCHHNTERGQSRSRAWWNQCDSPTIRL